MSNISPANSGRSFRWIDYWFKRSFFSDTDWRSMISQSGLPDQVTSLVSRVVSESRLSRFEKSQVTKDLLAHFEDGNERGKPFQKLIDNFGDPTTAAALIRTSKLRNRSMMSKLFRGSMWSGFAGLTCYFGILGFFHMEIPHVSVDYTSEINQAANSAAEEDKAWKIYRDVWAKHGLLEGRQDQESRFKLENLYIKEGDEQVRFAKPSDGEQWEIATRELAGAADLLESFRVGGVLPALGLALQSDQNKYSSEDQAALFPYHPAGEPFDIALGIRGISAEADLIVAESMVYILLPHIQSFRSAARTLRVDTRWAIEQDDFERATRNIEAVFGMGNQAAENPFMVCSLVGIAVRRIGYSIIDESLSHGKFKNFDEQQLARIQYAISQHSAENMMSLEGERLALKDTIQRVYSDDGNGDGRMTPVGQEVLCVLNSSLHITPLESDFDKFMDSPQVRQLTAPVAFLTMPTRKQMTEKLDELMDETKARFYAPIHQDDMSDLATRVKALRKDGYLFFGDMIPAYTNCRRAMFRALTNQGGAKMAIAAYRYHKQNGAFPQSSEELVGEFLDAIPTDQLNGDPLNYKLTEDGFRVYSVGYDLDDDGGQPIMIKAAAAVASESEEQTGAKPLATVDGMRPQAANEFEWEAAPKDTEGDWVIWPRFAEAEDDLPQPLAIVNP